VQPVDKDQDSKSSALSRGFLLCSLSEDGPGACRPRLNARYGIEEETVIGTRGNGGDAPIGGFVRAGANRRHVVYGVVRPPHRDSGVRSTFNHSWKDELVERRQGSQPRCLVAIKTGGGTTTAPKLGKINTR
jgi:hypothetical protein